MSSIQNFGWAQVAVVLAVAQLLGIILRLITEWLKLRRELLERDARRKRQRKKVHWPRTKRSRQVAAWRRKRPTKGRHAR